MTEINGQYSINFFLKMHFNYYLLQNKTTIINTLEAERCYDLLTNAMFKNVLSKQ